MASIIFPVSYEVEVLYHAESPFTDEPIPDTVIIHTTVPKPMEPYLKLHALDDFYRKWKEGLIHD